MPFRTKPADKVLTLLLLQEFFLKTFQVARILAETF